MAKGRWISQSIVMDSVAIAAGSRVGSPPLYVERTRQTGPLPTRATMRAARAVRRYLAGGRWGSSSVVQEICRACGSRLSSVGEFLQLAEDDSGHCCCLPTSETSLLSPGEEQAWPRSRNKEISAFVKAERKRARRILRGYKVKVA